MARRRTVSTWLFEFMAVHNFTQCLLNVSLACSIYKLIAAIGRRNLPPQLSCNLVSSPQTKCLQAGWKDPILPLPLCEMYSSATCSTEASGQKNQAVTVRTKKLCASSRLSCC
eukprot:810903-Amphidinium_carterae.1